ncbi:MAG TPA: hypothetical protein DEA22_01225, partial [Blastocatellia bacterium]|nr:hypothetical protein [Blastocatellia bacterium]
MFGWILKIANSAEMSKQRQRQTFGNAAASKKALFNKSAASTAPHLLADGRRKPYTVFFHNRAFVLNGRYFTLGAVQCIYLGGFVRNFVFVFLLFAFLASAAFGQVDSIVGQFTNSFQASFAGAMSGDGRFVVFESAGNLATENPRNSDGNIEIFLFDYAQRRIFQITDTKSVLIDPTINPNFNNILVEVTNRRPVISNDGHWIAFGSNATASTPSVPDTTNPGNFDGNAFTNSEGVNPLSADGNMEMWLYQIPGFAPADLTAGEELPLTNLAGGLFIRVTNTPASRLPIPSTDTTGAFIADDNHDAS